MSSKTNTQGAIERAKLALHSIIKRVIQAFTFEDASVNEGIDELLANIREGQAMTTSLCTDTVTHRHCLDKFA